jgi:hypothetical protein
MGRTDQKSKNITPMDTPIITRAWESLKPQPLIMPVPISHHFQGSVRYIKKGTQEASSVIPEAKA